MDIDTRPSTMQKASTQKRQDYFSPVLPGRIRSPSVLGAAVASDLPCSTSRNRGRTRPTYCWHCCCWHYHCCWHCKNCSCWRHSGL